MLAGTELHMKTKCHFQLIVENGIQNGYINTYWHIKEDLYNILTLISGIKRLLHVLDILKPSPQFIYV